MLVIKKDNTTEEFIDEKIIDAVKKAAFRCDTVIDEDGLRRIATEVRARLGDRTDVTVAELHELVIAVLSFLQYKQVAEAYAEYRYYKTTYARTFEQLRQDADDVLRLGDRENANYDSSLVSTKGSLIKGYLTKSLYKQFYLSGKEKALIERGDIYIHDLRDMILGCINCCLFDIGHVLKDGFEMSNVQYSEPKTVLSALQVIGDITLVATAQQFGGFTLPELDKVLLPYVMKSLAAARHKYADLGLDADTIARVTARDVERELEQGFQSLELKLNTVPCSRGDFAFTTITFGQWDPAKFSEEERHWLMKISSIMLQVRRNGHGKDGKPVVFPKLVYLYDEKQIAEDKASSELLDEAVKTSAQCMYPDYLSLSSENGSVSEIFQKYGAITSPMGCRAFLSLWQNEAGEAITVGRCNIGAVSLNLPIILKLAQLRHPDSWRTDFWRILDERLEFIRAFFKKRYDIIRNQKCSSNPLAFTQGGFYEGTKSPDDRVGDLVRYMTASFGITALDEATYLWSGKRLVEEGGDFSASVLRHLKEKLQTFKEEDGYLYAIYGTPAESLCATQARQYDRFCADEGVDNVFRHTEHYSPEYFTNSFHVNVTEDITPFEKQDREFIDFHLCEGGHIQYVRLDNPENFAAVKAVIARGMKKGFYQGVNFDSAYCGDCGQHSTNVLFKCPHCGSENLSVISRVCGYLGYSNVNGMSRMNDGKMAEIRNRRSM
ncbi:MAG: anaerobic ribonucleoside-triphosphate reductase [Sutterella wadsworthensis]|nr:anaerobic ribonucleoside-triphosphate reductase [Sutterella wadsworthensis]